MNVNLKKKKKIKNTPQFQTSKKVEQIKRDLHQSPDAKMSTVLLVCHASIANFQHIRIYPEKIIGRIRKTSSQLELISALP